MGRSKGGKNKYWSKEEKLRIVKKVIEEGKSSYAVAKEENIVSASMIRRWTKVYVEKGENALENKKKRSIILCFLVSYFAMGFLLSPHYLTKNQFLLLFSTTTDNKLFFVTF